MGFELVLNTKESEDAGAHKGVGSRFFKDLPHGYRVFLLYYRAGMPDKELEKDLTELGKNTGNNLYVNLGRADDDTYPMIVRRFGIKKFPVIIMTAVADLAAGNDGAETTFARLDSDTLLSSPKATVACAEKLFNLFIQGKVAEAISKANWTQRVQLLNVLANTVVDAVKTVGNFIASRDISFSALDGKFELKRSGD